VGKGLSRVRVEKSDPLLTKPKSRLDGFREAPSLFLANFKPVLDDGDNRWQALDGGRLVRPVDCPIDPDAEIPLLLEKCEKISRFSSFWLWLPLSGLRVSCYREGDEKPAPLKRFEEGFGD
jgi:hypothetical protein